MNTTVKTLIENATSMALATNGEDGINIVPLSSWTVHEDKVLLYDFFMNKTAKNCKNNPKVALTCWNGFEGVQVKGVATYHTVGEIYTTSKEAMLRKFPDRTLKGIITVKIEKVYDVAPGTNGELMYLK